MMRPLSASLLTAIMTSAACLLPGCTSTTSTGSLEDPAGRAAPQPDIPVMSRESRELRAYYSSVQSALLAQDLLRTDGGGRDTPYTADMLARNFKKIALYEEYANVGGNIVAKETASKLHRWDEPVRIKVEFGGAVTSDQVRTDRRATATYAARIDRITGHPVRMVEENANFHVFVVDEAARQALGPRLREIIPSITPGAIKTVTALPRSSYCLVFAWDPEDDGTYAQAVAVIRAEHPDLLRLSCIHEEIAQGMGLANDSPGARPSVFNDDEEFGLLTAHDEELLRIRYDRRLRPGMTAAEAMPIVNQIAAERTGGPS